MTLGRADRRGALEADIRARLGLVPAIFRTDDGSTELAEQLWGQAKTAYLDNEIPSVFKEELFTYLSRFCEVPYCMLRHAAFLQGVPQPAGDPNALPLGPAGVLALLRRPIASAAELEKHLDVLAGLEQPVDAWPADALSPVGEALLACSVHVSIPGGPRGRCLAALREALGAAKLEKLISLLGFARTLHVWAEAQPELEPEEDVQELLRAQPDLRAWADEYRSIVSAEIEARGADLLEPTREHEQLKQSQEQLGAILQDNLNEIFVFDAETLRFTQVNRGARENLGYSLEEFRCLTPVDLKPEFTARSFAELVAPLRAGKVPRLEFTTTHRRKDGSLYPAEVHLQLSSIGGRSSFVAIILDITERRSQEEAIAEAEARAQAILNAAADAILTINELGTIESVNAATSALFGYEESELVGHNVRMLMPPRFGDEHDGYLERYRRTGEARIIGRDRELAARHKDGSVFPIRLSIGEVTFDHVRLFTGIIHDLTETRALHEQLLQSQKMEAIGSLAGGIAHDFNNLLTSIRGSSEILAEHSEPGGRLARSASRIQRAADRATALTTRLLGLSRSQVTHRRPVELNRVVEDTSDLFLRTLPEDVELKTQLGDEPLYVRADENQIGQVLMNLIVNGGDATDGGGRLAVSTVCEVVAGARAERADVPPGDYAVVRVRDTGSGIPPETLARIFDPFFTTKQVGKGTGLGLSTSLTIVREHGGAIEVDSAVGTGTTFAVLLPAIAAPAPESVADVEAVTRTRAAGETVLLVEDDEIMRELLTEILEEEHYRVVGAADPEDAITSSQAHEDRIDLVITDVVMPKMSGFTLAKELRGHHPEVRILYMSGYTDQILADRGELGPDDPFIRKPFDNDSLLGKIREVLDASEPTG